MLTLAQALEPRGIGQLDGLEVDDGQLSPDFEAGITQYQLTLDPAVFSVAVTPTAGTFYRAVSPPTLSIKLQPGIVPFRVLGFLSKNTMPY